MTEPKKEETLKEAYDRVFNYDPTDEEVEAKYDDEFNKWLDELEDQLTPLDDTGIYKTNIEGVSTNFITTTEVEDNERIHHLLIIPSLEVAWQMRDEFTVKNMDAVIMAVSHECFSKFTMAEVDEFFGLGKKVLLDIKGVLNRKEYEDAGYCYWRL